MKPLTPTQRRELRASAHHLDPVVIVGHQGLTPAVQHEIDLALLKHELIKVRVGSEDRAARAVLLDAICAAADCAPVQQLGKVFVLWRPNPALKKKVPVELRPSRTTAAKRNAPPKTGPRTPVDPVRERRRGARTDIGPVSGKGRRGAARFAVAGAEEVPAPPVARRKSSYTPKTKPKSFSAKPNPRTAWEKKPAGGDTKAPARPRRRRVGS
jgi:putative YhbY family RNA-binding protein